MDAFDHYQIGKRMMDEGRHSDAIAQFQESIVLSPHFKSLELLGECFSHLHRHKEAIIPLAAATALNKGVRAPSLLAEAFLLLEEYEDAYHMAELALQRDPNNRSAKRVKEHSEQGLKNN